MSLKRMLEYRDGIYGFSAIWILLFHVYTWTDIESPFQPLTNFLGSGNLGVDVFLFLSGACLALSFRGKEKIDLKGYFLRRLLRIGIPYLLISIPYWAWKCIVEVPEKTVGRSILKFVADSSSASFWLHGTQTTWFVFAIALFYILFPLIYRIISDRKLWHSIALLIVAWVIAALSIYVPVWKESAIAWTRLPIFIIGSIAGYHMEKCDLSGRKRTAIGLVCCSWLIFFGCCVIFSLRDNIGKQGFLWISYGFISMAVLLCLTSLTYVGKSVIRVIDSVFSKVGYCSLELYLVHIPVLHILRFTGVLEKAGGWNYLLAPAISLPVALLMAYICGKLRKRPVKKSERLREN